MITIECPLCHRLIDRLLVAKENLTVGMVTAYEAGLAEGKAQARRDVLIGLVENFKSQRAECRKIGKATLDPEGKNYWRGMAVGFRTAAECVEVILRGGEP